MVLQPTDSTGMSVLYPSDVASYNKTLSPKEMIQDCQ